MSEDTPLQRPKRPASAEIPNDAAAIDHVYERLNLIVAALVYAEGEARVLGSEETIHKTTAALASARRDLALHKVDEYARNH